MCDGVLAMLAFGKGIHDLAEAEVSADVGLDSALVFFKIAPGKGYIAAVDRVFLELGIQVAHGLLGLGDDYQAAGVLVYAVHQAYARESLRIDVLALEIPGQAVDQGAGIIATAGMDHHTCDLIDDKDVVILVDDIERELFGDYIKRLDLSGFIYSDLIMWLNLVVGLDDLTVYDDMTILKGLLDLVAGSPLDAVHQELIYPEGFLAFFRDYPDPLYRSGGFSFLNSFVRIIPIFFQFLFIDHLTKVVRETPKVKFQIQEGREAPSQTLPKREGDVGRGEERAGAAGREELCRAYGEAMQIHSDSVLTPY